MKYTRRIVLLILALICVISLVACGEDDKKEEERNKTPLEEKKLEFISVDNGSSAINAAQMNGLGDPLPVVSFSEDTMYLHAFGMDYPEVKYEERSKGIFDLSIEEESIGTIYLDEAKQVKIAISIQNVSQTYYFKIVE